MRNLFREMLVVFPFMGALLVAPASAIRAQDAPPPATVSPTVVEPLPPSSAPAPGPGSLPDAAVTPPLPTTIPAPLRPPLTPPQLVDKSIRDLQRGALGDVVNDDIKALRRGPLLIHGNYCGVGNRPGSIPTDPLDAACMRHDACTPTGGMPNCACDDRLRHEATAIAEDPASPPDIKVLASAMVASMVVLVCDQKPVIAQP